MQRNSTVALLAVIGAHACTVAVVVIARPLIYLPAYRAANVNDAEEPVISHRSRMYL